MEARDAGTLTALLSLFDEEAFLFTPVTRGLLSLWSSLLPVNSSAAAEESRSRAFIGVTGSRERWSMAG